MEAGAQEYAAKLNAVVQNLESRATALNARKREYEALMGMLQQLPEQMSHEVMVPVAGCAFFPGSIVHTNEILVLLGENYFAERTASQARQIIQRRLDFLKESIEAVERPLTAFQTRKDVIDDYQREGIVDIQEEYHSDEESQKKKMDAAREKEKQAEEEAVRRRNLFVKEVKTEKVEKTDEEFLRLERRLAELEAEEARVEHGGSKPTADAAASGEGEEEEEDDGEEEDGDEEDEGDAFDEFYTEGDDDESVSDDGEGEEEPEEISEEGEDEDEEKDTRANKQLKPVHLRTHTPPHPSKRPLKPASAPSSTPAATKGTVAAVAKAAEATELIEKPRVSFNTQTLPAYVRPPVPPGKLKPCLAPPRPITVAAPPPKEVRWTHSSDAELPRYKARPPPQPQPVVTGNRSRSSARGPPPPSMQALQAAAAAAAPAAESARNVAVGEVVERAAPAAAPPVAATEAQSAPAEAPRKVSRYRAMMEQRQGN